MEEKKFADNQNIIMENRNKLQVNGVLSVESFDEQEILTVTRLGTLNIRGDGIKIGSFNEEIGELTATGNFFAAVYIEDTKEKGGFFSRLFR